MKNLFILSSIILSSVGLASVASAQEQLDPPVLPQASPQGSGAGQSIMFQSQPGYDHLTTMPEKPSLGDRCQQMSREIESLKGKPQRRYSLMQRYKQECELKYFSQRDRPGLVGYLSFSA